MRLAHGSHPGLLAAEAASWWCAERHADVHLVVAGGVALPAHRCLLAAASRLARRLLSDLPPHAAPITVHLPEVGASEMRLLLQLLYTGNATVQPEDVDSFQSLMRLLEVPPSVWQSESWSKSPLPLDDRPADVHDLRVAASKQQQDEDLGGDLNIDVVGCDGDDDPEPLQRRRSPSPPPLSPAEPAASASPHRVIVAPPGRRKRRRRSSQCPVNLSARASEDQDGDDADSEPEHPAAVAGDAHDRLHDTTASDPRPAPAAAAPRAAAPRAAAPPAPPRAPEPPAALQEKDAAPRRPHPPVARQPARRAPVRGAAGRPQGDGRRGAHDVAGAQLPARELRGDAAPQAAAGLPELAGPEPALRAPHAVHVPARVLRPGGRAVPVAGPAAQARRPRRRRAPQPPDAAPPRAPRALRAQPAAEAADGRVLAAAPRRRQVHDATRGPPRPRRRQVPAAQRGRAAEPGARPGRPLPGPAGQAAPSPHRPPPPPPRPPAARPPAPRLRVRGAHPRPAVGAVGGAGHAAPSSAYPRRQRLRRHQPRHPGGRAVGPKRQPGRPRRPAESPAESSAQSQSAAQPAPAQPSAEPPAEPQPRGRDQRQGSPGREGHQGGRGDAGRDPGGHRGRHQGDDGQVGLGQGVPLPVLRQAVRHELEPQDAPASAHGREAVRVPAVRGHVQAEGPLAEAPVLRAPQRHLGRRGQPARWQRQRQRRGRRLALQLLLLPHGLRVPAGADPPLVRAPQLAAAQQKPARGERVILLPVRRNGSASRTGPAGRSRVRHSPCVRSMGSTRPGSTRGT